MTYAGSGRLGIETRFKDDAMTGADPGPSPGPKQRFLAGVTGWDVDRNANRLNDCLSSLLHVHCSGHRAWDAYLGWYGSSYLGLCSYFPG